jgi:hypothetical protein
MGEAVLRRATAWTGQRSSSMRSGQSLLRDAAWTGQRSSSMRSWAKLLLRERQHGMAVQFDDVEMEWMVHFDEDVDMEFEVEMNDDVDMDFEVEMDEDVDMEYCVIETHGL